MGTNNPSTKTTPLLKSIIRVEGLRKSYQDTRQLVEILITNQLSIRSHPRDVFVCFRIRDL
mgnify:CR=1 FL=1